MQQQLKKSLEVVGYPDKVVVSIIFCVPHLAQNARYADQPLIDEACLNKTLDAMDPEVLTAWHIMFERPTKCEVSRTESR